jgi:hypothetical protein
MSQAEPFPHADDFAPQPEGTPDYLKSAPAWFVAWRAEEFVPLTLKVSRHLTVKRVGLELGKLALYGGGTVVLTRFPELKSSLLPLLVQLLGGG